MFFRRRQQKYKKGSALQNLQKQLSEFKAAKMRAPANPLVRERDLSLITPIPKEKRHLLVDFFKARLRASLAEERRASARLGSLRGDGPGAKEAALDAEMATARTKAIRKAAGQFTRQEADRQVDDQYRMDYIHWLLGRGKEEDHLKTAWGRHDLLFLDDIKNYIEQFELAWADYMQKLVYLATSPYPKNMHESYLYFKYIVRQGGLSAKGQQLVFSDFLEDFQYFEFIDFPLDESGQEIRDDQDDEPHEKAGRIDLVHRVMRPPPSAEEKGAMEKAKGGQEIDEYTERISDRPVESAIFRKKDRILKRHTAQLDYTDDLSILPGAEDTKKLISEYVQSIQEKARRILKLGIGEVSQIHLPGESGASGVDTESLDIEESSEDTGSSPSSVRSASSSPLTTPRSSGQSTQLDKPDDVGLGESGESVVSTEDASQEALNDIQKEFSDEVTGGMTPQQLADHTEKFVQNIDNHGGPIDNMQYAVSLLRAAAGDKIGWIAPGELLRLVKNWINEHTAAVLSLAKTEKEFGTFIGYQQMTGMTPTPQTRVLEKYAGALDRWRVAVDDHNLPDAVKIQEVLTKLDTKDTKIPGFMSKKQKRLSEETLALADGRKKKYS